MIPTISLLAAQGGVEHLAAVVLVSSSHVSLALIEEVADPVLAAMELAYPLLAAMELAAPVLADPLPGGDGAGGPGSGGNGGGGPGPGGPGGGGHGVAGPAQAVSLRQPDLLSGWDRSILRVNTINQLLTTQQQATQFTKREIRIIATGSGAGHVVRPKKTFNIKEKNFDIAFCIPKEAAR